ncbi:hypothetical protein [Bacillus thuringiensis]|uniref:hypothetical protein n=1 Tax=Bacillus thuringiensis TaxID=1428 RepID=UPI000BFCAF9A|nr:hypothetical protein [Bacillus thuringiensis]PGT89813.1 hypothetical protein COD17_08680 [Bacillus thuringiensis]
MGNTINKADQFQKGDTLVITDGIGHWNEGEKVIYLGKHTDTIAHIQKENWNFKGWLDYDRLEKVKGDAE